MEEESEKAAFVTLLLERGWDVLQRAIPYFLILKLSLIHVYLSSKPPFQRDQSEDVFHLWRHQDHQRHVEVVGECGKGERVVGVQDKEGGPGSKKTSGDKKTEQAPARVGEEVPREEAAVLLDSLPRRLDLSARSHEDPAQVVTGVLRHWTYWEGAVCRDVEKEGSWKHRV